MFVLQSLHTFRLLQKLLYWIITTSQLECWARFPPKVAMWTKNAQKIRQNSKWPFILAATTAHHANSVCLRELPMSIIIFNISFWWWYRVWAQKYNDRDFMCPFHFFFLSVNDKNGTISRQQFWIFYINLCWAVEYCWFPEREIKPKYFINYL